MPHEKLEHQNWISNRIQDTRIIAHRISEIASAKVGDLLTKIIMHENGRSNYDQNHPSLKECLENKKIKTAIDNRKISETECEDILKKVCNQHMTILGNYSTSIRHKLAAIVDPEFSSVIAHLIKDIKNLDSPLDDRLRIIGNLSIFGNKKMILNDTIESIERYIEKKQIGAIDEKI